MSASTTSSLPQEQLFIEKRTAVSGLIDKTQEILEKIDDFKRENAGFVLSYPDGNLAVNTC